MWETLRTVVTVILMGCMELLKRGCLVFVFFFVFLIPSLLLYSPVVDVTRSDSQDLARSVLGRCNIRESRLKKLHHGHKTMSSPHGDHFGAYAMELSHVDVYFLTPERGWIRGDRVNGALENTIRSALFTTRTENVKWFPKEQEVKSADMFIFTFSLEPFSLVLIRPSDRMVFYVYCIT